MNFQTFKMGASFGVGLAILATIASAGDLSKLEFRDRASGEIRALDTWAGGVVVLDFFAYWCAPCRPASAKIEAELAAHYESVLNAHGAQVTVLAVNVESGRPEKTEKFIEDLGLSHVVDDIDGQALEALKARGLPFLVVLDGTAVAAGKTDWRITYQRNGLESITKLRAAIEDINPGKEMSR